MQIAAKLPLSMKYALKYAYSIIPLHIRYGKTFRDTYRFLQESQWWSRDQLEEYQLDQLKQLIQHAYENVPYYRRVFDERGLKPKHFQDFKDLRQLPYLTKEQVKQNYHDLISKKAAKSNYKIDYTGGSTSEPMKFLVDREFFPRELAYFKFIWEMFGYRYGAKCVEIRGAKVARPDRKIFWINDPISNHLIMDSDYLNDNNSTIYYFNKIRRYKSNFLFGYPSSIYLLARKKVALDIKDFPEIKLIILGSENTYHWQLEFIKKAFNCCNICYHYGHSEKANLAVKCLNKNFLHFFPQYGYTELITKKDQQAQVGELGEIVATSYCKSFPLIRYRTTDYAVLSSEECGCLWKNYLTVSHIEGRLQEFIVTKDKRLVSICTMGAAHFKNMEEVMSTQYYQDTEGELIFRMSPMPNKNITNNSINKIKSALEQKLEHTVDVHIEVVDSINSTQSGKHLMIEQKLDVERYM